MVKVNNMLTVYFSVFEIIHNSSMLKLESFHIPTVFRNVFVSYNLNIIQPHLLVTEGPKCTIHSRSPI